MPHKRTGLKELHVRRKQLCKAYNNLMISIDGVFRRRATFTFNIDFRVYTIDLAQSRFIYSRPRKSAADFLQRPRIVKYFRANILSQKIFLIVLHLHRFFSVKICYRDVLMRWKILKRDKRQKTRVFALQRSICLDFL